MKKMLALMTAGLLSVSACGGNFIYCGETTMEAFADDFSDLDEEQFSEANISLADEGFIEDHGEIVTCYFEK